MIELDKELSCNGTIIASHLLIPENSKEKEIGMKGYDISPDLAMLFVFSRKELLLFNMWEVKERLGIIVLDDKKIISHVGVMRAWIGGFFGKGKYVIEVHPDRIKGIKKGYSVSGLD